VHLEPERTRAPDNVAGEPRDALLAGPYGREVVEVLQMTALSQTRGRPLVHDPAAWQRAWPHPRGHVHPMGTTASRGISRAPGDTSFPCSSLTSTAPARTARKPNHGFKALGSSRW